MVELRTGQIWKYRTRPGQERSRLLVLAVDSYERAGEIVHVAVRDLAIPSPHAPGGVAREIGHSPFAIAAVRDSVTELVGEGEPVADYVDGLCEWRSAFEAGRAGAWTTGVAEVVATIERALAGQAE